MLAIIGQAIRQLREENGISPEELAARANITTEQLHCIETNRTTPSFRVLLRLSRALGAKLGTFFGGKEEDRTPVVMRAAELAENPVFAGNDTERNGNLRFYALAQGKADRHMEPLVVEIAPGDERSAIARGRQSEHPGEEFLYILSGQATLYYGSKTHRLQPGDSIYYSAAVPHRVVNETSKPVRILAVLYTPY